MSDQTTTTTPTTPAPAGGIGTTRLEAFSDGVFAIATTLLILEITVPQLEGDQAGGLGEKLLAQWPSYLAYLVGFYTIGIMWLNHHFLLGLIRRVDRPLIFANLGLLVAIAFVPYPTAVLAEYLTSANSADVGAALVLYGIAMLLISVFFTLMWAHARRAPELLKAPDAAPPIIRRALMFCALSILGYLVAIAIAFVAPVISALLLVTIVGLFTIGRFAK